MYSPFEVRKILDSMQILVDTREQPNRKFKKRVAQFRSPWKRQKLDYGDYSASFIDLDGAEITIADKVVIERKMDGNELAACFGRERKRFEREFQRAREVGAKIYLLTENETWESIYSGQYGKDPRYRSKMKPESLVASIHAFQARYRINLQFCEEDTTGMLIEDILKYELRELLENENC